VLFRSPSYDELGLYHDQVADESTRSYVEGHLKTCLGCQHKYEEMAGTLAHFTEEEVTEQDKERIRHLVYGPDLLDDIIQQVKEVMAMFREKEMIFSGACGSNEQVVEYQKGPIVASVEKSENVCFRVELKKIELKGKLRILLKAGTLERDFVLDKQLTKHSIGYKLVFAPEEQKKLAPLSQWIVQVVKK
jgi:hypothetical protein